MVHQVKDSDDMKAQLKAAGDKLVVVDFFATWCGPCKAISPKVEELAQTLGDAVVFLKVDVDECEDLAAEYGISSMPTFIFIKNGETLEQFSGASFDKLQETVKRRQ
ncbi:thioredoxin-2 [Venturia canescens]|uniref:thioredoxin-2 n=1 Tax=Venturia canescens TaxID=32260 RepID=UPI001C9CEA43|nr:thioredoxin-2 [Venturia canescens]